MPFEELEVRITKEGFVYVDTRGMQPERVRSVVDYLREVLGPQREIRTDPKDWPAQTINLDADARDRLAETLDGEDERTSDRRRVRLGE